LQFAWFLPHLRGNPAFSFLVLTQAANMPPDMPLGLIEDRHFSQFTGWVWSQRTREVTSWIWNEGYDIQHNDDYRWACKRCVKLNRQPPTSFLATGLQNAREHLWREHNIDAPNGKKKKKQHN
jgi:hypothetical protein